MGGRRARVRHPQLSGAAAKPGRGHHHRAWPPGAEEHLGDDGGDPAGIPDQHRHRCAAGVRHFHVAGVLAHRAAAVDLVPGHSEGGDRPPAPGVVRIRPASEGSGRVPDRVLSDCHQHRGRPCLDRTGEDLSGSFDGSWRHRDLLQDSPAECAAVDLRRIEDFDHARRRRRRGGRVRRRRSRPRIHADGGQWQHGHAVTVRRADRADDPGRRALRPGRMGRASRYSAVRSRAATAARHAATGWRWALKPFLRTRWPPSP